MEWKDLSMLAILESVRMELEPFGRLVGKLIRNRTLVVLLPLIGIFDCPIAFGQSSFTQSPSVSIGIAQGLSAYTNTNLNFGTVVSGAGTYSVAVTSASAGEVTIQGQWNTTVYVTLTPPASLTNGVNTIPYTPRAAFDNSADNPAVSTEWIPPTGRQTGFRLRANHAGQSGQAFVYIFGSINVGSVPPGTYSGTYVVAVSYF